MFYSMAISIERLKAELSDSVYTLLEEAAQICHAKDWKLYIVGGQVRDLLLNIPGTDIDLAIEGNATEVARDLAERRSIGFIAHQKFGTATLRFDNFSLDIVTARSERYPMPGALPEVFPGSIKDDLERRDFSINSMAISLNQQDFGEIVDPSGGMYDLEHRLIRILHPNSFLDDATRIFRALRYEQRFSFGIEPQTLASLIEHKKYLASITPERLRYEFECIFAEAFPEKILKRASDLSVLSQLNSCLAFGCRESCWFEQARDFYKPGHPSFSLYMCLMCSSLDSIEIQKLSSKLGLTAGDYHILKEVAELNSRLKTLDFNNLSASNLHQQLRQVNQTAITACLITADEPAVKENLRYYLDTLQFIKTELNGHDITSMGVPQGPRVGEILKIILDAKVDGLVKTRQDEEKLVLGLVGKNG